MIKFLFDELNDIAAEPRVLVGDVWGSGIAVSVVFCS